MKKAAPTWTKKLRRWTVTAAIVVAPLMLIRMGISHLINGLKGEVSSQSSAYAEIKLRPGQSILLNLPSLDRPIKIEGVFLRTRFRSDIQQPPNAWAEIEAVGGVKWRKTMTSPPVVIEYPYPPEGYYIVYPGGVGKLTVFSTSGEDRVSS